MNELERITDANDQLRRSFPALLRNPTHPVPVRINIDAPRPQNDLIRAAAKKPIGTAFRLAIGYQLAHFASYILTLTVRFAILGALGYAAYYAIKASGILR